MTRQSTPDVRQKRTINIIKKTVQTEPRTHDLIPLPCSCYGTPIAKPSEGFVRWTTKL